MGRGLVAPEGSPGWPLPPAAAAPRTVDAGERLFRQGEPCTGLHWLDSGAVALRRLDPLGNQSLVRLALRGDLLGHQALAAGSPHAATAQALTPCRVRAMCAGAARGWLERSPEARAALACRLAEDFERAEERQLVLALWPVVARLCWALRQLADRLAEGDALLLPLSRQDLASWIGARPETVARAIQCLESRGLARFSGRRVLFERTALATASDGLDLDQEPAGAERAE